MRDFEKLFRFDLLTYTSTTQESKALNMRVGPMILIAGSGMAEGGRILHHLVHGAANPRNTILIVGYQAEHTLGRRIVERRQEIRVLGQDIPLRAKVEVLNGYSAHGDRTELLGWLNAVRSTSPALRKVFLVHGETSAQDSFATRLRALSYQVESPSRGDIVEVNSLRSRCPAVGVYRPCLWPEWLRSCCSSCSR